MTPASPAASLTDAAGVDHEPAGGDVRIVSLVPSITELLFDLGLGGRVVGRTAFCVHPEGHVERARTVGGTKTVKLDRVRDLNPTHVIVNIDETPKDVADEIAATGCAVVVTHPMEPRDNIALYRLMGGLFGRARRAEALCARFEDALATLLRSAEGLPKRSVLYLIWKKPWMTVSRDTYIARTLSLVGWRTVGHDARVRYPAVDITAALLRRTDVVLFASEPFPFTETHMEEFAGAYPCRGVRLAAIDAQMVSWYGSRAIAGLRYLEDLAAGIG
ncbi:MAG: ABC transporter substrate-binding protein [Proteobacteria bacterium]|nr:ABC transporter substrate-binding protein [Pseudomonadota bacterium]